MEVSDRDDRSDLESVKSFSDFEIHDSSASSTREAAYIDRTFNELSHVEQSLTEARNEQTKKRNKILLLIFCSLGILIFYLIFGIAQESVTKQGFGDGFPNGPDRWTYMLSLVWVSYSIYYS